MTRISFQTEEKDLIFLEKSFKLFQVDCPNPDWEKLGEFGECSDFPPYELFGSARWECKHHTREETVTAWVAKSEKIQKIH